MPCSVLFLVQLFNSAHSALLNSAASLNATHYQKDTITNGGICKQKIDKNDISNIDDLCDLYPTASPIPIIIDIDIDEHSDIDVEPNTSACSGYELMSDSESSDTDNETEDNEFETMKTEWIYNHNIRHCDKIDVSL
eukprot:190600_1